ncbi:MAG TPA: YceI family protein [Mariniphaga anaerophila]|uniref:YceI family protein n=1 Tax=Mariniphaga anaerophila TaxID=1484053 RepID=A0A831LWT9_9BACT|nr:YceI family protein [Mariniphaga anaerophila]
MKKLKFNFLLTSVLTLLVFASVQAQEFYKVQTSKSKLVVSGTSSLHDWEMEATDFNAETLIKLNDNAVSEISRIEFTSPVSGLKSGKRIMDNKTLEALNEKKFPEIKFSLDNNGEINLMGEKANLTGKLTIAGKTREVKLTVDFDVQNTQRFQVTGNVPLKMSDFGVEPPTALMGTVKTDDELVVSFDLEFQKSSDQFTENF